MVVKRLISFMFVCLQPSPMAETAISLMLQCSICQEQFIDPRVLPCQHTFCLHCLEKIAEKRSTTESIPCPVCCTACDLSMNAIDELPKNIFQADLISIVRQGIIQEHKWSVAGNTRNKQLCTLDADECSRPATVYCDICDVYMCEQCELSHKKNKFTRKHQTLAATTRQKQQHCPKHKSMLLHLFCDDCSSIMCSSCLSEHQEHKYRDLKDKVDDFSGQLGRVLDQTDQTLITVRKYIKLTEEKAVQVKSDVIKVKQQTSAAYRTIKRHVDEQEGCHLAKIDEYYIEAEKVISKTLQTQKSLEAVLHSIQLYGQHLSKGSAYDLTTNVRSLVKRSEEEKSESVPELRWKVDLTWSEWEVKDEVDRVRLVREGEVNVESDQQLTTVTGQSATRGDHNVQKLNTFTTHCNNEVRGIVSYHNHLFVVHYDHDNLYVYDESGRLKRSVQISCRKNKSKMGNPYGICLVKGEGATHSLVISDYHSQCLWWLTTEKQTGDVKLGQPQQHDLPYHPWGVSTDMSGRAVVADYSGRRVYVYNHPGQYVTRLQLSCDEKPWQALTDQSDGYVVRLGYNAQLVWVNSAGQVTRRYTDQPNIRPHHIVDDGTYLLVSDPDHHCVHIVTREGRHDGHLITDIDPTCVCLDPAGRRLWVAHRWKDGKKHVMKMSYTPSLLDPVSPVTSQVTSPATSLDTSNHHVVGLTLKVILPKIII